MDRIFESVMSSGHVCIECGFLYISVAVQTEPLSFHFRLLWVWSWFSLRLSVGEVFSIPFRALLTLVGPFFFSSPLIVQCCCGGRQLERGRERERETRNQRETQWHISSVLCDAHSQE